MPLFPTIVYRTPGPFSGNGFTYATLGVNDADALKAALTAGWHPTLPDACAPKLAPVPVAPAAPDDDAPPTRAELEAKAGELGVKFDGRTPDATLARKIADALKAGV
jgi:hypothetical protein